jgi:hypothetical protein
MRHFVVVKTFIFNSGELYMAFYTICIAALLLLLHTLFAAIAVFMAKSVYLL